MHGRLLPPSAQSGTLLVMVARPRRVKLQLVDAQRQAHSMSIAAPGHARKSACVRERSRVIMLRQVWKRRSTQWQLPLSGSHRA